MVTVLTAGHVNWDVTLRVDTLPAPDSEATIHAQHQGGGGSAANVATALSRLEVDTGLIGSVGDDDNGLLARRDLERAGIDLSGVRVVEDAETAVKYLLVDADGEVAVLGNDGVNEAVRPEDVDPGAIRETLHVHLTSQRPDTAAEIAEIASEAGIPVSFDPGRRLGRRDYGEALAYADVIFVNDLEAEAILEAEYPGSDVSDRIVVVKRGGDGAEVHAPSGSYVHPGFDVDSVDTTGAGDAFAAGFIATRLQGGDLERALEYGNACGALAAGEQGARTGPEAGEVVGFLEDRF